MRQTVLVPVFLAVALAIPASAQDLASRVAQVRDGRVRLSFATLPEVCGDGSFVGIDTPRGFRTWRFSGNGYSSDLLEDVMPECDTGPMRLVVVKAGGRVTGLRAAVGVAWRATDGATDLGIVAPAEVVSWLLDLVPTLEPGEEAAVAFLAVSSAAGVRVSQRLLAAARNRALAVPVRAAALRWASETGLREGTGSAVSDAIRAVAGDATEVATLRDRAIRELDLSAANLAFLHSLYGRTAETVLRERILRRAGEARTDAEAAWLTGVIEDGSQPRQLRDRALRVLGQEMGRPEAVRALYPRLDTDLKARALQLTLELARGDGIAWVREIALNTTEPVTARDRAIRLLAERGELAFLQQNYFRLGATEVKDRVLRLVAERNSTEGRAWLSGVAADAGESVALRERALRLVAQHGGTGADLASLYDRVNQAGLKERVIRLLAERGDDAAVAKLIAVARTDADASLRRVAMRRLGESRHEKAREFIRNTVTQ